MELHGGNIYRIERELNIKKEDIVDFSSNINPLGISTNLKKAIINNLSLIEKYPDPEYRDLKKVIAEYTNFKTEKIIAGNGATELIYLYARTISPKSALIVSPTFIEYYIALKLTGAKVTHFKLKEENEFILDVGDLKKELNKSYSVLIICNPNNPTGKHVMDNKIEEIIACAAKKGTRVMLDESFIEFADPDLTGLIESRFKYYKNLFILRSLTKFFAIPGLRLGYGIVFNNKLALKLKKNQHSWTINQFADLAAKVVLNDKEYIEKTIKVVKKERLFLYNNINKTGWLKAFNSAANFVLVKILNEITSSELKSFLLKDRILIRDASNFKYLNNKFIRIAVKNRTNNEMLLNKLIKMKTFYLK